MKRSEFDCMNKKNILITSGIALILFCLFIGFLENQKTEIRLSEKTIQTELNKAFPITFIKLGAKFTFYDEDVQLLDEGRIKAYTKVHVEWRGREAFGSSTLLSGIRYNANHGSFYLKEVELKDFEIDKYSTIQNDSAIGKGLFSKLNSKLGINKDVLKGIIRDNLTQLKEIASRKIQDRAESVAIYTFNKDDMKQQIALWALSGIRVEDENLILEISWETGAMKLLIYGLGFLVLVLSCCGTLLIFPGALLAGVAVGSL
jgi:hypothetical protein